jgi:hypothetical protein
MRPVVEAAWIATGTAAIGIIASASVGISGLRNTRKATQETVQSERLLRLWDKRAAAYEQALADLLHRKENRRALLAGGWIARESQERFQNWLDSYDESKWWEMNGRLLAYSTDDVGDAVDAANEAHRQILEQNEQVKNLEEQNQTADPAMQPGIVDAIASARQTLTATLRHSADAENALIDVIRAELRIEPSEVALSSRPLDLMGGPDPG